MTRHTVVLDLASALATPHRCSACTADLVTRAAGPGEVLFTCARCKLSWRFELGDLVPVGVARDVRG